MATKKKNGKGITTGSANPRNRAALEAAGMKPKKKTAAKKKTTTSSIDKGTRARIDAARKRYLEKAKKAKKK